MVSFILSSERLVLVPRIFLLSFLPYSLQLNLVHQAIGLIIFIRKTKKIKKIEQNYFIELEFTKNGY